MKEALELETSRMRTEIRHFEYLTGMAERPAADRRRLRLNALDEVDAFPRRVLVLTMVEGLTLAEAAEKLKVDVELAQTAIAIGQIQSSADFSLPSRHSCRDISPRVLSRSRSPRRPKV